MAGFYAASDLEATVAIAKAARTRQGRPVSLAQVLVLLVAAFLSGLINAIAGGGTLVSFPALVWVGLDPIVANATNTVALWPGSLAAMVGLRRELDPVRRWLMLLTGPCLLGGLLGAVLLLWTPSRIFAVIVPYLMLVATALFALQGPMMRMLNSSPAAPRTGSQPAAANGFLLFQFVVAVYGGYFGAGIGLMTLAGLGLFGFTDVHEMIGIRNWCAFVINGIAAAYFVVGGHVSWPEAGVMLIGQVGGGYAGASVARRFTGPAVRRWIVILGLCMTASLFIREAVR